VLVQWSRTEKGSRIHARLIWSRAYEAAVTRSRRTPQSQGSSGAPAPSSCRRAAWRLGAGGLRVA
jgi:hypothetical protein